MASGSTLASGSPHRSCGRNRGRRGFFQSVRRGRPGGRRGRTLGATSQSAKLVPLPEHRVSTQKLRRDARIDEDEAAPLKETPEGDHLFLGESPVGAVGVVHIDDGEAHHRRIGEGFDEDGKRIGRGAWCAPPRRRCAEGWGGRRDIGGARGSPWTSCATCRAPGFDADAGATALGAEGDCSRPR